MFLGNNKPPPPSWEGGGGFSRGGGLLFPQNINIINIIDLSLVLSTFWGQEH